MNSVSLIGNLTKDPEMRTTGNGTPVTSFNLAVNTGWGDNQRTAFVPVTVWNKIAENCHQFLSKGSKVALVGRLETDSYEKDGKTVYTWKVTANNVIFLNTKTKDNQDYNNVEGTDNIPF